MGPNARIAVLKKTFRAGPPSLTPKLLSRHPNPKLKSNEPEVEVENEEVIDITPEPQPTHEPATPAQTLPAPATSMEVAVPQQRTRISDHPLAALGLPTEYIPIGVTGDGLQEALTSAFERLLPKTPNIRASKGSVICIVGDRYDAMEIAEEIAEQFGRPAEEVVLASQTYRGKGAANVIRTVRSAEDAQRSWSRRPRPTIVAIEATPGLPRRQLGRAFAYCVRTNCYLRCR